MSRNKHNVIKITTNNTADALQRNVDSKCNCASIDCRSQICVDTLNVFLPDELITSSNVVDTSCCSECCGYSNMIPNHDKVENFTQQFGTCFSPCDLGNEECASINKTTGVILTGECKPYLNSYKQISSQFWYPHDYTEFVLNRVHQNVNPNLNYKLGNYDYLSLNSTKNIYAPENLGYCHCDYNTDFGELQSELYVGSDWIWYYWPDGLIVNGIEKVITNEQWIEENENKLLSSLLYDVSHEKHFETPFNNRKNDFSVSIQPTEITKGQKAIQWPTSQYCVVEEAGNDINPVSNNITKPGARTTFDLSNGVKIDNVKGYIATSGDIKSILNNFCQLKGYDEYIQHSSTETSFKLNNIFTKASFDGPFSYYSRTDYLKSNKNK